MINVCGSTLKFKGRKVVEVLGLIFVLDYPEAESEYNTYNQLVDELQEQQNIIQESINVFLLNEDNYVDEAGVLGGKYYEEYLVTLSKWHTDASKLREEICDFSDKLKNKITEFKKKRDMWQGRINIGHYEEDEL